MPDDLASAKRELLEKTLIAPARSVLLVDDEYPTLDKMLSGYIEDGDVWSKSKAKAQDNAARVRDIISYCRTPQRNWHVDVHDGENVTFKKEAETAGNLHQSDLLFLDFHLDGDSEDPDKCLDILQHLAESDHFNLVAIVTKEDVQRTFDKVVAKFLKPRFQEIMTAKSYDEIDTIIHDWSEDEKKPFHTRLIESVSLDALLKLPAVTEIAFDSKVVAALLGGVFSILEEAPDGIDRNMALQWAIMAAERKIAPEGKTMIEHSSLDADQKWLCARNLFVTVVPKVKEDQGKSIINGLIDALVSWNPTANRLVLIKFRSEIEAKGLSLGTELFARKAMQAEWLRRLIMADEERRKSEIDEAVRRHGEALISIVSPAVRETVLASLALEDKPTALDRISSTFDVDLRNKASKERAALEHNLTVSNCAVKGWHLEPGHIFMYKTDYWIVLTPACDLVPSQQRQRAGHLTGLMPFKAVKLRRLDQELRNVLSKADHNLTTFVEIDESPTFLHFLTGNSANSEVHWNEFFAQDVGKLGEGRTITIATAESEDGKSLKFEWYPTNICAQVRYEYAINLMQVLGSKTIRVGLDFIKPS